MYNSNNTSPLKILCIHGYRQNGEIFRQKTGSLRKLLKSEAEFSFVSAPNKLISIDEPQDTGDKDNYGPRGWWFTNENNTFESKTYSDVCIGLEESVAVIESAFEELGPFDGVLGFSQGAALVSMLCAMQRQGAFQHKVNFAIMVAGFKSRCSLHDVYYETTINIPSLHIFGETDQVIPKEMSEELLQFFKDPVSATHEGGHYVPAHKREKQIFVDFFEAVKSK